MGTSLHNTFAAIGTEARRAFRKICELEVEIDLHVCIPRHRNDMLNKTGRIKSYLEEIESKVRKAL